MIMKITAALLATSVLVACGGTTPPAVTAPAQTQAEIAAATKAAADAAATKAAADAPSVVDGIRQFPITDPILDTSPVTSPDDINFGKLLNGIRLGSGVADVAFDSRLNLAAQKHAQDMVDNDYFNHISQDGRAPADRVRAEGYNYAIVGENIAQSQQSDAGVIGAWQTSPAHDALMRRGDVEDFALGVAGVGTETRWVLLMGTEKP
ncbi:MAG: hypothetical protein ACI90E_002604 [Yoonia sp.]|jgi:uncharacterized protein YkwD